MEWRFVQETRWVDVGAEIDGCWSGDGLFVYIRDLLIFDVVFVRVTISRYRRERR